MQLNNRLVVVDDEAATLQLIDKMLLPNTYDVFLFNRPLDALVFLEESEVGVIISDQCMPQMEGTAFLDKTHLYNPEAIKILLTGYEDSTMPLSIQTPPIWRMIKKDCSSQQLRAAVAQAFQLYNRPRG